MRERAMSVAGHFYPNNSNEIEAMIAAWERSNVTLDRKVITPKAVIVPHAGYIYSGYTAYEAYRLMPHYKRVVVIGPSHREYLEGMSIGRFETYATPKGTMPMDDAFALELQEIFHLPFEARMHLEHSTEVQIPLIQSVNPSTKIVEIVYGKVRSDTLAEVIDYCLEQSDTMVVISTDLSHFYTQEEAIVRDTLCLEGIASLDISCFDVGCEACGLTGVKAMVKVAAKRGFSVDLIDYRSSASVNRDTQSVVGYVSAILG